MSYLAECCKELLSGGPMEFKTNGPLISELANKIAEISGDQTATVGAMNKIIREALEVVAGMGAEPQTSAATEREPIAFINKRLADLAEANALYGKDQRLSAPDKIARNDREISWLKELRSIILTEPQRAQLTEVIAPCNGEHSKFEEWAAAEKYDMQEHPIHYLFTDPKTYAARQGWKAALRYVSSIL